MTRVRATSLKHLIMAAFLLTECVANGMQTGFYIKEESGKRFVVSGTVLSVHVLSRVTCGSVCYLKATCVAFNYKGSTMECELLSSAAVSSTEMATDAGWDYYRQRYLNLQRVVDPCSSNPCPADRVCVSYEQPVYHRYRYDLDFYMCSRHTWLLGERSAGRTKCRHLFDYGEDYYSYSNMAGWTAVAKPYTEAFQYCVQNNCRGLLCTNMRSGNDVCYLKSWNGLAGQPLDPPPQTRQGYEWVMWYPKCT